MKDLQPFVCISEECAENRSSYASRNEVCTSRRISDPLRNSRTQEPGLGGASFCHRVPRSLDALFPFSTSGNVLTPAQVI